MDHLIGLDLVDLAEGCGQPAGLHIGGGKKAGHDGAVGSEHLGGDDPLGHQALADDGRGFNLIGGEDISIDRPRRYDTMAGNALCLDAVHHVQVAVYD